MKSAPESVQEALHSFFETAAANLEMTVENLCGTSASLPQSRGQQARGVGRVLSYTTSILLPTLTSLFQHLGNQNYGVDLLGKNYLSIGHCKGRILMWSALVNCSSKCLLPLLCSEINVFLNAMNFS